MPLIIYDIIFQPDAFFQFDCYRIFLIRRQWSWAQCDQMARLFFNIWLIITRKKCHTLAKIMSLTMFIPWAVVVVKWSACTTSNLTIRVWIPLKPTVFLFNLCLKGTKINKKRPGLAHFFKKIQSWSRSRIFWANVKSDKFRNFVFGENNLAPVGQWLWLSW